MLDAAARPVRAPSICDAEIAQTFSQAGSSSAAIENAMMGGPLPSWAEIPAGHPDGVERFASSEQQQHAAVRPLS